MHLVENRLWKKERKLKTVLKKEKNQVPLLLTYTILLSDSQ